MSLSLSLNTALTALQTNQASLQIVSSNISNASTEGYTRKSAERNALVLAGQGSGVELGAIKRTVDESLLREIRDTLGKLGTEKVKGPVFDQVQDLFGQPGDNSSIGATLTNLANAFEALAATPDGSTEQIEVVNAALAATRQFDSMSKELQRLRGDVERQLTATIDEVNATLQEIADLNDEIVLRVASNQSAAEFQDKRDKALKDLSSYLDIQTFTRSSGEVVVFASEGTLLDSFPNFLSHNQLDVVSAGSTHANGDIDGISLNNRDITNTLKNGELKGLIEMRDKVLPGLQAEIDKLAAVLRDEVNALHNKGTSTPPAQSLTGSRLFESANDVVAVSGTIRFAVVDAEGRVPDNLATAQPFEVDLSGMTAPVTLQNVVDEINLQAAANPPQTVRAQLVTEGTGVRLQVSTLNGGHRLVVDSGNSQVTGFTPDGGAAEPVALQNGTAPGFSHFFGLNDFFVSPSYGTGQANIVGLTQALDVRSDLKTDPAGISRGSSAFSLPLTGGQSLVASGDTSILQGIAERFDQPITFPATGNLSASKTTLAGYAAEIVFQASTAAVRSESNASIQESLRSELQYRSDSLSGVNVDEELSQMIVIQQAYSASARMVTTIQELFAVLQNMV